MKKNIRNKKHLKRLQNMPCIVCAAPGEPHHLLRAGGKGMGLKAGDDKCVPLCHRHHHELHMNGDEIKFFQKYGIEYNFVKKVAEKLYQESIK